MMKRYAAVAIGAAALAGSGVVVAQDATQDLLVSAEIIGACELGIDGDDWTFDFGIYDPADTEPNDTELTFFVACSLDTEFHVELDGGANELEGQRRMLEDGGAAFLAYGLFSDDARTEEWTDVNFPGPFVSAGPDTPTDLTLYGRIPAEQDVPAGVYNDTVQISVVIN